MRYFVIIIINNGNIMIDPFEADPHVRTNFVHTYSRFVQDLHMRNVPLGYRCWRDFIKLKRRVFNYIVHISRDINICKCIPREFQTIFGNALRNLTVYK